MQIQHEPGLADTWLAHHGHQAGGPVADRATEQIVQQLPLPDAAHEWGRVVLFPFGGVGAHVRRHVGVQRVRLALDAGRGQRLVLDHVARRTLGRLADDHRTLRCERLQPRRGVDDVAGDTLAYGGALARGHQSLARVHRDAHRQVAVGDTVADREGGSDGPLGVVLVGPRRPEDAHRRVTDELVERAAEPLDLLFRDLVERHEDAPNVLGVGAVAVLGEPGEVGEHDRDESPFLEGRGAGRGSVWTGAPQDGQNRACGGTSAPHVAHRRASGVPHDAQKRAASSFDAWQFGHRMATGRV